MAGTSARSLALIDTTISAPLNQLAMVPMLVLIAKSAPAGGEATMFAIMASLMNLALSASQLFTWYLNEAFVVSQHDYSSLGRLTVTVAAIGLVPLLALPLLWRHERAAPSRQISLPRRPLLHHRVNHDTRRQAIRSVPGALATRVSTGQLGPAPRFLSLPLVGN